MKAILYKRDDNFYSLKVDGIVMATSNGMLVDYNLSKQNCDELFGVVDVNSEVEDIVKTICPDDRGKDVIYGTGMAVGIQCFNKAMELNNDKVFTRQDVEKVIEMSRKGSMVEQHNGYGRPIESIFVLDNLPTDEIIQSLQQPTEIEVEIDMSNIYAVPEPKIDSEGCLILKRL